jgi:hypothetical protein
MATKNLVYFLLFENPQDEASWYPGDYLEQLAICLRSLRDTSDPTRFDLLFLADRKMAARLQALPELAGFTHETRLFAVPPDLGVAMCTRYMIHAIMREQLARYEKVLCVDVDVVFLRSVERLFEAVQDPERLYVKPDHWGGTGVDDRWYALGTHGPEEAARFAAEGVRVFNSGQFAFVNGPPMRALFGALCAAMPALWPLSRGLDQPVMNSFLRSRHLQAPCLEQRALDPLVHLATAEEAPRTGETVLVHFIKGDKLARMKQEMEARRQLTFITTCRGRRAHLEQSLPTFVAQPGAACVVVDYGCPDGTGAWVEEHFPEVRVVRVTDRPRFEMARARNLGAAVAETPWLCFIDADVRIAKDFMARTRGLFTPGHYYQAQPRDLETWGTSVSAREDFARAGGYDEVLQGWGKDDDDYYARLSLAGVRAATFPGELLLPLRHDDEARVVHHEVKDRWLNESVNHVYCRAKIDLSLLQRGPLALDLRRRLYEQVRAVVIEGYESGEASQITLAFLVEETRLCGPLEARLVYTLPRPRGDGGPNVEAASLVPRMAPR